MASSSVDAAPSAAAAPPSVADVPPEVRDLRPKPQARGNIGPGKRYADQVAFDDDVAAWEMEREERRALMAERRAANDRLRDRSGRVRDVDGTDNERRVCQRHAGLEQHADREAARRREQHRQKQQAWARDVATFAAIFQSAAPRAHPLAYEGFRGGRWLKDGDKILALHEHVVRNPPTGEPAWEDGIDDCAHRVWRDPSKKASADMEDGWYFYTHPGDGYWMLLSLPSAPKSLANHFFLKERSGLGTVGIPVGLPNDERAARGKEPLPGWEAIVEAGYMPQPAYFALDAAEVRRRRASAALDDAYLDGLSLGAFRARGWHLRDRDTKVWRDLKADEICCCHFKLCRCAIGVVLDDTDMRPVLPRRVAKLQQC
jgi:hypothetical protein